MYVCVCVRVGERERERERGRVRDLTTAIGLFGVATFSFAVSNLLICGAIWWLNLFNVNVDLVTQWVVCLGWWVRF